ncbi:MAG TPA: tetratricopeptide repeat protein, partial [Planctomycetaceae bacterium]|nr:tetratricopeptide repeat protein [Planctomycetaceae bacterium]
MDRRVRHLRRVAIPLVAIAALGSAVPRASGQLFGARAVESHRRGVQAAERGDFDQAIQWFTRAIRLNPNLAEAYRDRGLMYIHRHQPARAIPDLNMAVRLKSADATA